MKKIFEGFLSTLFCWLILADLVFGGPPAPKKLKGNLKNDGIQLTWDLSENVQGVIVLRSLSHIYWFPENGKNYKKGDNPKKDYTIVYVGNDFSFFEPEVKRTSSYVYQVYSYDEKLNYSFPTYFQINTPIEKKLFFPLYCKASQSPLFDGPDSKEFLEVELNSDFDLINGGPEKKHAKSWGTLTFLDKSGESKTLKGILHARGNWRFRECGMRPLEIYIPKGEKKGTPFEKTGKRLKIVTHCGPKSNQDTTFRASSDEIYDQWLFKELTLYQIANVLNTASLKTRPVYIHYKDRGNALFKKPAFFIENKNKLAKRCGVQWIKKKENFPNDFNHKHFEEFFTKFMIHNDYTGNGVHNSILLKRPNGQTVSYPFDYDMSGIFRYNYHANRGRRIGANTQIFKSWLNGYEKRPEIYTLYAKLFLSKEQDFLRVIGSSPMGMSGKESFSSWIENYTKILKNYLRKKSK